MKADRSGRGQAFARDDGGSFPVVEAILVVILVLTAILFFTSVQRPTTGSEAGGIDLGQVAGDTLRIVQLREFDADVDSTTAPYQGDNLAFEEWVTNLAAGDGSLGTGETAAKLEEFLGEILPTGARYSLRLSNGVESMQILPQGATESPQGATASEVVFVPDWSPYASQAVTSPAASPGQTVTATSHPILHGWTTSSSINCIRSPVAAGGGTTGSSTGPDGSDSGSAGDPWVTVWKATPGVIPSNAPFGTWAAYTDAACTLGVQYGKVVRDSSAIRFCTAATANKLTNVLTTTADCFLPTDDDTPRQPIKALWAGNGTLATPGEATILTYTDARTATLSDITKDSAAGALTVTIGIDNPNPPYAVQLVVWFGA